MRKLIYTEWIKISRNRVFWITFAVYMVAISLILLGVRSLIINFNANVAQATQGMSVLPTEIFQFPDVWQNLTFLAKFTKILLGILMILIVTNELNYNTLRQNIINGMSRGEFVVAKLIDALVLALVATIIIFLFALVAGIINTPSLSLSLVFTRFYFVPGYFFMLSGYLAMVLLLAILLKKAILTVGALILYSNIIEPLLAWKFEGPGRYLPGKVFNNFIPAPRTVLSELLNIKTSNESISFHNLLFTLLYLLGFSLLTYYLVKKRDL